MGHYAHPISGIYKIWSKMKPERIYIGSAINIGRRWTRHRGELKRNVHGSSKLQRHCNKYGIDDLCFEVLLVCDKDKLIEKEQFFLDTLKPYFNVCPTAYSPRGRIVTDATREKLRKCGNYKKGHVPWNKGKTECYSEGTLNKMRENLKKQSVPPHTGHKHSLESRKKMSEAHKGQPSWNKGKKATEEARRNQSIAHLGHAPWNKGLRGVTTPVNRRPILQFTSEGEFIRRWEYIALAVKELGLTRGNISAALGGRQRMAGGFIWEYVVDNDIIEG
jgi:group I intron endonuclease